MKRSFWVLVAILILAAAMRFFQLDAQSFWNDEGTSARVAERSLPLITAAAIGDIHPPLYYYVLHFWRGLWGASEFALRGLSAEELRPPRLLTGHDLLAMGYAQGPLIGEILRALEEEQLEGRLAGREAALAWVRERFPAKSGGAG